MKKKYNKKKVDHYEDKREIVKRRKKIFEINIYYYIKYKWVN